MSFTLLSIVLISLLFAIYIFDVKRNINFVIPSKIAYLSIFLFAILSGLTMRSYLSPDEEVFRNARYHTLKLNAIEKPLKFSIIDEDNQDKSIWEDMDGKFMIDAKPTKSTIGLDIKSVYQPVYVRKKGARFKVVNAPIEVNANGEIVFTLEDSSTFYLKIENIGTRTYYSFKFPDIKNKYNKSYFTSRLKEGYDLSNILEKTASSKDINQYLDLLKNTFLIREKLGDRSSRLFLYPGKQLSNSLKSLKINKSNIAWNNTLLSKYVDVKENDKVRFGFGKFKQRDFYLKRINKNNRILLKYDFPEQYPLYNDDSGLQECLITSNQKQLIENNGNKGFLFARINSTSNKNHFTAGINYNVGKANEKMKFAVVDFNNPNQEKRTLYNAGDDIVLEASSDNDTKWHLEVENLIDTNPLRFSHIYNFFLFNLFFIFLMIAISKRYTISKIEVAIYLTVIFLLTIRLFLLWRSSVFIPITDISKVLYYNLRGYGGIKIPFLGSNKYLIQNTLFPLIIFYGSIFIYKTTKIGNGLKNLLNSIINLFNKDKLTSSFVRSMIPVIFYAISLAISIADLRIGNYSVERFANILFPITIYFFFDYIFEILYKNEEKNIPGIVNWFLAFGYLAISDTGFSYIFLNFSLLWILFKQVSYSNKNKKFYPKKVLIQALSIFIFNLIFIFYSPYLLVYLLDNPAFTTIIFLLIFAILVSGFFFYKFFKNKTRKNYLVISIFVLLGIFAIGYFGFNKITKQIENKSYVKYRAELLYKNADEIISDESFGASGIRQLLQSAENQWYISYFYKKGKGADIFGKLYSLESHFKQGVSYITQTTDLVTTRYIIGEHSEFLIILILVVFFFIFFIAYKDFSANILSNYVGIKLLFLLFSIAFFIWMTSTNRFIFFGQDFPMLSMQSLFSPLLTLLFFSVVIITSIKQRSNEIDNISDFVPKRRKVKRGGLVIYIPAMIISTLIFGFINNHYENTNNFNLSNTVRELDDNLEEMNQYFRSYQLTKGNDFRKLTPEKRIDSFLVSGHFPESSIDSIFESKFSKTSFDRFLKNYRKNNNPENLIHYRITNGGLVTFAINRGFFRLKSPDFEKDQWGGNIISNFNPNSWYLTSNISDKPLLINNHELSSNILNSGKNQKNKFSLRSVKNISISIMPKGWTVQNDPTLIISKTIGQSNNTKYRYSIRNKNEIISDKIGQGMAMIVKPNDKIILYNSKKSYDLFYTKNNKEYLSKSYWLNGKNEHYYPLGEKFIWAYHFNNYLKSTIKPDDPRFRKDINVSIVPKLHEEMYKIALAHYLGYDKIVKGKNKHIRGKIDGSSNRNVKMKMGMSLVILDGDGHIWDIFDFQLGKYMQKSVLNPNRKKDFNKKINEFYLVSNRTQERQALGNKSLMRMDNGPGSTIKPIFYSSVNSGFNLKWQNLNFKPPTKEQLSKIRDTKDNLLYHYYGGRKVKWFLDGGNLSEDNTDCTSFIYRSKNVYLSMILFLGSLTEKELALQYKGLKNNSYLDNNSYLKRGYAKELTGNLPLLKYNNKLFHINKFPNDFGSTESLLAKGLWYNFNLPVQFNHQRESLYNIYPNNQTNLDNVHSHSKMWAFPEPSHLYMIDRASNSTQTAIIQLTSGANPLNVTPLKMAEMNLSLFTFNPTFKSVINLDYKQEKSEWAKSDTWKSLKEYKAFTSNYTFDGMFKAITITHGTAKKLKSFTQKYPNLFFYAKTGTLNDEIFKEYNDKMLTLVISKKKLHKVNLTDNYIKDNKIIILYFAFYKNSKRGGGFPYYTAQKMIKRILESGTFKNYFYEKK